MKQENLSRIAVVTLLLKVTVSIAYHAVYTIAYNSHFGCPFSAVPTLK